MSYTLSLKGKMIKCSEKDRIRICRKFLREVLAYFFCRLAETICCKKLLYIKNYIF